MGFMGGLAGAAGGFMAGGPLGAGLGLVSGLSNNDQKQEQRKLLRGYTDNESGAINSAYGNLGASQQAMAPGQRDAYIGDLTNTMFNAQSGQIQQGYRQAMGNSLVNNARGGMLGSSQAMNAGRNIGADLGASLGNAWAGSRMNAENMYNNRDANRRGNVQSSLGVIGANKGYRLGEAGQQSTVFGNEANTGMALGGLGLAMDSPWASAANKWIGGKMGFGNKKKTPSYSNWEMTTDVVGD